MNATCAHQLINRNQEINRFVIVFGVQHGKAADPVIMHARARHSTRFLSTGIRVKLVTKIQYGRNVCTLVWVQLYTVYFLRVSRPF